MSFTILFDSKINVITVMRLNGIKNKIISLENSFIFIKDFYVSEDFLSIDIDYRIEPNETAINKEEVKNKIKKVFEHIEISEITFND